MNVSLLRPAWTLRLAALFGALAVSAAVAQELRDPTRPPAALEAPAPASADALPISSEGLSVVVREGQPQLVVGTRLYGVGQQVGSYRLERITETEVWLRDGRGLRKLPRFAGVQRSVVADAGCARPVAAPAPQKKSSTKPPSRETRSAKTPVAAPATEPAAQASPPCEPSLP